MERETRMKNRGIAAILEFEFAGSLTEAFFSAQRKSNK